MYAAVLPRSRVFPSYTTTRGDPGHRRRLHVYYYYYYYVVFVTILFVFIFFSSSAFLVLRPTMITRAIRTCSVHIYIYNIFVHNIMIYTRRVLRVMSSWRPSSSKGDGPDTPSRRHGLRCNAYAHIISIINVYTYMCVCVSFIILL